MRERRERLDALRLERQRGHAEKRKSHCTDGQDDSGGKEPEKKSEEHGQKEKSLQWAAMFNIQCAPDRTRKPEAEILEDVARCVATECLRLRPRLPLALDGKDSPLTGGLLPIVHCGFTDCPMGFNASRYGHR